MMYQPISIVNSEVSKCIVVYKNKKLYYISDLPKYYLQQIILIYLQMNLKYIF